VTTSPDNIFDPVEAARAWLKDNTTRRRATINDIAKIANVSKRTISRIINKSPHVAKKTREDILQIIEIVGFQPDPQARGLAFRHSFLFGFIYGNPNPQYVTTLQRGILDGLSESDYALVSHPIDLQKPNYLEKARAFIQRQKLFGVILSTPIAEDEAFVSMLREIGCTYVRIAAKRLEPGDHMIVTHDRKGAESVADHFSQLGHTRIGFIAGRKGFLSAKERYEGFKTALEFRGLSLPDEFVAQGDYTFSSGVKAAEELLKEHPRPTAIFAANDEMAAGALLAVRFAELDSPDDVSIVGFDNFHIAETVWPRLTTINSPTYKVGQMAAKILLGDKIELDNFAIDEPNLVIRDSSASPK